MIVIRYKGGLGNQMFQYALHKILQETYPEEVVKADLSHYLLQKEHNGFELDSVFGFQETSVSRKEVLSIANIYVPGKLYEILPDGIQKRIAENWQHKFMAWKKKMYPGKNPNFYRQSFHNSFESWMFSLDLSHDWYLEGLWQNMLYWTRGELTEKEAVTKIQGIFSFEDAKYLNDNKLKEAKELLEEENAVGIHVRRGDFANSKFDICPLEYYKQAISYVKEKINTPKFYFFTDDVEYVKQTFSHLNEMKNLVTVDNIRIIAHGAVRSDIDMWLMSKCSNLIISNSTFSYWGAMLGKQENRVIVAPKYSVKSSRGEFELSAPGNWTLLDNIHI